MVKVNWTDSAIIDLNEIGECISKDSVRYAQLTVDRLFNSVDILEDHPRSGKMVSEFQNDKIRVIEKIKKIESHYFSRRLYFYYISISINIQYQLISNLLTINGGGFIGLPDYPKISTSFTESFLSIRQTSSPGKNS